MVIVPKCLVIAEDGKYALDELFRSMMWDYSEDANPSRESKYSYYNVCDNWCSTFDNNNDGNICNVDELATNYLPKLEAIVTPDGFWHDNETDDSFNISKILLKYRNGKYICTLISFTKPQL